eukprot:TRINITY_DN34394_c0_g1_i1.p1 TRINITY_DN34394_c0_g1~~TRINITY_DN34394_c0_g1_i1.p1  ORF type:complete len:237 (+),score=29.07 TRINITY_DN34394_c0_g1_i1:2-712(+)
MRMPLLVWVLGFVVLAAPAAGQTAVLQGMIPTQDDHYDFLLLRARWPPAECELGKCSQGIPSEVLGFTLHGVWPSRWDGSKEPGYCGGAEFVWDQICDLKNDLARYWADLQNPEAPMDFYQHEWDKHGTCAADITPSEHAYFAMAIRAMESFPLQEALSRGGVAPNRETLYDADQVLDAVRVAYGAEPVLFCDEKDGVNLLQSIGLCLDRNLQAIKCSTAVASRGTCSSAFSYLPF